MISLYFKHLKKIDWLFILIVIGLVVAQVYFDLKMPDYTANITTLVQTESAFPGSITMGQIWEQGSKMLYCALGTMTCAIICGFFTSRIAANFAKTLRKELFAKISSFSAAEMNRFTTPSLITRTTNDVVHMQMFTAMGIQLLIKAPVLAIWAILKISNSSMYWTIATAATVGIIVVSVSILVGFTLPKFRRIQKLTDELNDVTRENISGVRVVRAFNAEDYQNDKFEVVNNKVMRNHLFTTRTMGLMMPIMTICMNALMLAIYWIGSYLIDKAPLTERLSILGDMTAFTSYALQVVMAFMMLIIIFILLPRTSVAGRRIKEVLITEPQIKSGTVTEAPESGTIEFKNVSFSYSNDINALAINDISFKVSKGETVAFIGATGSGKSTIVNLIPRYYDITAGEVLVNGVNVKEYNEESLQKAVAIAPQKAVLFRGTVKSNVTYGYDGDIADEDERITKALRISQASFVNELDNTVNAAVAQGGTNFSGGQKQRLSIARTIFKDSDIMIFDDTFSALDYKTDMLVRKAIKEELDNKTVLIIAQRIGTIKNADKIIVLDDGKIVGMGTHKELLESCSVYKEIALSQLREEEL